MKFRTADLIKNAEAEIAARKAKVEKDKADAAAAAVEAREKWLAESGPLFVQFADKVKEKIRKGRPIVRDDIPLGMRSQYSSELKVFSHYTPSAQQARTGELEALLKLLRATGDEFITTSALQTFGFHPRDFRGVFS